jgi:hypothetical protein
VAGRHTRALGMRAAASAISSFRPSLPQSHCRWAGHGSDSAERGFRAARSPCSAVCTLLWLRVTPNRCVPRLRTASESPSRRIPRQAVRPAPDCTRFRHTRAAAAAAAPRFAPPSPARRAPGESRACGRPVRRGPARRTGSPEPGPRAWWEEGPGPTIVKIRSPAGAAPPPSLGGRFRRATGAWCRQPGGPLQKQIHHQHQPRGPARGRPPVPPEWHPSRPADSPPSPSPRSYARLDELAANSAATTACRPPRHAGRQKPGSISLS